MTNSTSRHLYVIGWLALGAIAIVYFFILFQTVRDKDSSVTASANTASTLDATGAPGTDPALENAITRMKAEIDRLKESLEATRKENTALKAHINTLESTYDPTTTAALPPEEKKPEPKQPEVKKTEERSTPRPEVEIAMRDLPTDGFDALTPASPLPISGQARPKRTEFAVEIASGLREERVEVRWLELKAQYSRMLKDLTPRAHQSGGTDSGPTYNLVVGPFRNAAAAARLCARLSAAGAKCEGAVFAGSPLDKLAKR